MARQPLLHDRLVCLAAPTQVWSGLDGQIRPGAGVDGGYHADVRVLASAVLTVDDAEPEAIAAAPTGVGGLRVSGLLRGLGDGGADPTVRIDRVRSVMPGRIAETFEVSAAAAEPVSATLALTVGADLVPMDVVKSGRGGTPVAAEVDDGGAVVWSDGPVRAVLAAPGADIDLDDPTAPVLRWHVDVREGAPASVGYEVRAHDAAAAVTAAPRRPWSVPEMSAGPERLRALLAQSMDDLAGLAMASVDLPDETFVAAGAPWFFTLFGRDSLWTARMLLPLGTDLAGSTLRTLAARQGERDDPTTAEQPGKILHEVRRAAIDIHDAAEGSFVLPPVYYGTIDATPLWLCLLHDAWRWGMPAAEVEALLPHAEQALEWLASGGDADGDGFLEYVDETGQGLANQGWKDSGDSVRWRDGRLAEGAIALCEVQAYAYEAALGGAALLEAFGRPGAERWRGWAAGLRKRFRAQFWVEDEQGRYPAIALDGDKHPVDSLTSNIGHLLGTGLLDATEERLVADRLTSSVLASGFGVHTLAHGSGGFWPLRYHGGTVWPHDTAIGIWGLWRAGFGDEADRLAGDLLRAAPAFDYRLPELFSGDRAEDASVPAPYPAACRPQAWTAASAVVLLSVTLGLEPDVPAGRLTVRPTGAGPLHVTGLRLGPHALDVAVSADGDVRLQTEASIAVGQERS